MKELACRDVTSLVCDFVAEGLTDAEVTASLMQHGEDEHPDEMAAMSPEESATMADDIKSRLAAQEDEEV